MMVYQSIIDGLVPERTKEMRKMGPSVNGSKRGRSLQEDLP